MRVNLRMTFSVMFFDMFKLRRVAKGGNAPVEIPHPLVQCRIPGSDIANVAFEMLDVDWIEADNGGVETHVGFRDLVSKVVWRGVLGQVGFGTVQ